MGVTPFVNWSLLVIVWDCFCDSTLSRFDTIPACDGQTDRQTYDDGWYRASIASRGNKTSGEIR